MKESFHTSRTLSLGFAIVWSMILIGCTTATQPSLTIAVSKQSDAYVQWLQRNDSTVKTINLYPLGIDSALSILNGCNGLLLTGGEDVYPGYYDQLADTSRCGEFDHYRDSLEMALIDFAVQHKIPILGVCRGEQILNVALEGSLVVDIPTDFDTTVIHQQEDYLNCIHPVTAVSGSILIEMTGAKSDSVTSNHHQAIDRLAEPLSIVAYAPDSLPEAVSWKNPENHGFLFAMQWHPERMKPGRPYSDPIGHAFLAKANAYHK
ncbi:MAG: hypothetical protein CVT99_00420 [Bacteroidetes bacterium HGW-Bacteroidetes-16]|jgi:putative glutamine amidotransferase|nr:MAG: hypothetical protein CVT99_00420 [Bacteroidetes bacterium HGW-Bacteroidetes-16]